MRSVADIWRHGGAVSHPDCYMGIELEAEGYTGDYGGHILAFWNIIEDHSLRDGGVEFVNKAPVRGADLRASIDELADFLRGHCVHLSHRCSMHVHIDVRDKDIEFIEKLYRIYTLFEPALYYAGVKDRYENIYCPGLTHATEQVKTAGQAFSVKSLTRLVDYGCKYTGFNFLPMREFGSVEIRTHAGTLDMREMHAWIDTLQAIIKFASVNTLEDVKELASLDVDMAATLVWGESLARTIICPPLYKYWGNAKLNLLYLDLIDEALLSYDEGADRSSENFIDYDELRTAVEQAMGENGLCAD